VLIFFFLFGFCRAAHIENKTTVVHPLYDYVPPELVNLFLSNMSVCFLFFIFLMLDVFFDTSCSAFPPPSLSFFLFWGACTCACWFVAAVAARRRTCIAW
jgi:hypothetical protein